MDKMTSFLTMMGLLSTASNQITDHLLNAHLPIIQWLREQKADTAAENRRQTAIHLLCGTVGALLCCSIHYRPITAMVAGANVPAIDVVWEYVVVGLLVSYGGSFFNESLDLLREFKLAQERARKKMAADDAASASK